SDLGQPDDTPCGPMMEGRCTGAVCRAPDGGVLTVDAGSGTGGGGGGTAGGGGVAGGASGGTAGGETVTADGGTFSHYAWNQPSCRCSGASGPLGLALLAGAMLRRRRARAWLLLPLLLFATTASAESRLKLA